jgi:hypothetical protein
VGERGFIRAVVDFRNVGAHFGCLASRLRRSAEGRADPSAPASRPPSPKPQSTLFPSRPSRHLAIQIRIIPAVAIATCVGTTVTLDAQARAGGRGAAPQTVTGVGTVQLTDPAGDVGPIVFLASVGTGPSREVKHPGLDVVALSIVSDGTRLTLSATLAAPPGNAASTVVEYFVDVDNKRETGVTIAAADARLAGLEFTGELSLCIERDLFGIACIGETQKLIARSAVLTLDKYGSEWMFTDPVVGRPMTGPAPEARQTPVMGSIVSSAIDYASLGVKPGQTIRLVLREHLTPDVGTIKRGYFPEVVLTLR